MKKKSIDHTQLLLLKLLAGEDMYGYQIPCCTAWSERAMWRPMKRLRPQAACANTITSRAPGAQRSRKRKHLGGSIPGR